MILTFSFLSACTSADPTEPSGHDTSPPPVAADTSSTDTSSTDTSSTDTSSTDTGGADTGSADTGDTGTVETLDCSVLPAGPFDFETVGTFSNSEDFDFDLDGNVLLMENGHLVKMTIDGDLSILSPSVSSNVAGLRVLSTGDVVVADVSAGRLRLIDAKTGGTSMLAGGFNWPNGIEIGSEDHIYLSDFSTGRVHSLQLDDPSAMTIVAGGLQQANGVGLSPDEDVLYVLESWSAAVLAFDLQKDGTWGPAREVHTKLNGSFQGLNVDACGNVYWTDVAPDGNSNLSYLWRYSPDTMVAEHIATLDSGYVSNIRFGSGVGGWEQDVLYASDRYHGRIFSIEVGIPGRPHPAK